MAEIRNPYRDFFLVSLAVDEMIMCLDEKGMPHEEIMEIEYRISAVILSAIFRTEAIDRLAEIHSGMF